MTNAELLGNKLYELRKKHHLSQEELAEKLGVSRQAVSKWECGESLPDTDNLITISKLYGVSLDELVGNKSAEQTREPQQENNDTPNPENTSNTHKNGIHIGDDGVHIGGDNGIHISNEGVHVGGKKGIHLTNDGVSLGEGNVNINVHVEAPSAKCVKKTVAMRLLMHLPYPILITIAYLLWGFLGDGWDVGWTLYVTVPVYYSLLDCIKKGKASHFAYPVLVTFIYLLVGMQWGFWHPNWILFVTIPIYYAIVEAIEKK